MPKFKDFGGASAQPAGEPISFKLHGEDFSCRASVQGKLLLRLVASSNDPVAGAESINSFFKMVLVDESYKRFEALCNDDEKIVPVETLGEIVGWLVEQYSDRPTQRPEGSPSGQ